MELSVIGSSSKGNAYVLQNASEALLLEAGVNFKVTLPVLGYDLKKVVGCLITHEHGDHAGHVSEVLNYGVRVLASEGTIEGAARFIKSEYAIEPFERTAEGYSPLQLGGFTVIPWQAQHDANEPTGFYIWHRETGGVLFATDTYYIAPRFAGLSNILIECNYDPERLEANYEAGYLDHKRYERTLKSHMGLDTCLAFLQANDISLVNNLVLIHLSQDNGDAIRFKDRITQATGKEVTIAHPGLKIEFNQTPF